MWRELLQSPYWLGCAANVQSTPPRPGAAASLPCPMREALLRSFSTELRGQCLLPEE